MVYFFQLDIMALVKFNYPLSKIERKSEEISLKGSDNRHFMASCIAYCN